jgi:hypothetical protein
VSSTKLAARHPVRPGRAEAASVVWKWQSSGAADARPDARPLRLRGALQASAGLAVAAGFAWWGLRTPATIVGGIACAIGLAALVSPFGVFAAIERAFAMLGRWAGQALTWILLPMIFYLFFTPFSLLFRRGRRDSMKRHFDPAAASYWTSRERRSGTTASASHERPY